MAERWPFVGRDEELQVLADSLRITSAMVAGTAGVGKSRLAAELIDQVESTGRPVGRCVANRSTLTVPFGAMIHLLPPLGNASADVTYVLSSARRHLTDAYAGGLVSVDDAHLLDEASASLLYHLARDRQVGVLVTVRSTDPAPDAIDALWREGLVERIELQPLSAQETRQVLEQVCGGPVSSQTVSRFFAISEGNALFLRELVSEALASGELTDRDGTWSWSGAVRGTVRLTTMVARHTERLSPEARRVLELVAMVEPLPLSVLEGMSTPHAVDEASAAGVIVVGREDGDVRVRHPLFAELVYARMPAEVFRRNVRNLAAHLIGGDRGATPTQATQLAILHLDCDLPASAELFHSAARHAIAGGDSVLGERLARAAVSADGGSYASSMSLALALGAQNRFAEVVEVLSALEGREPHDAAIAELAYARMRALLFGGLDSPSAARTVAVEARARIADDGCRAVLDSALAEIALNQSDLAAAEELATTVLDGAAAKPEARLLAAHVASLAHTLSGRSEGGVRIAEDHWHSALSASVDVPAARGWMLLDRWLGLVYSGRLDQARAMCHELIADPAIGAPGFEGSVSLFEGRMHLLAGRPVSAEASLRDAVGALRVEDPRHYLEWALALCGAACALQGRVADARALCDEAERRSVGFRRLFDSDRVLASAWVLAAEGMLSSARQLAEAVGRRSVAAGQRSFATLALHDALRLGSKTVVGALVDTARRCDGPIAAAISAHAEAMRTGAPDDLAAAGDQLVRAGLLVAGAEAHATAAGQYRRAGIPARALASSARAEVALAACEGIRTPLVLARSLVDLGLTPREHEVVTLAADGASNNEIAARLFTSTRTVEGHLLRAFRKLGVSRRQELCQLLGTRPTSASSVTRDIG